MTFKKACLAQAGKQFLCRVRMTELERLRNPYGLNFDDHATSALSPVFDPKVFNTAP